LLSLKEKERLPRNKEIREKIGHFQNIPILFCSALDGSGVNLIFEEIAKMIFGDSKINLIENELKEAVKDLLISKLK
jgi:hypothetical protein